MDHIRFVWELHHRKEEARTQHSKREGNGVVVIAFDYYADDTASTPFAFNLVSFGSQADAKR